MAQPKRRWSKARTGLRRSAWKLEKPNFAECPHCHETLETSLSINSTFFRPEFND